MDLLKKQETDQTLEEQKEYINIQTMWILRTWKNLVQTWELSAQYVGYVNFFLSFHWKREMKIKVLEKNSYLLFFILQTTECSKDMFGFDVLTFSAKWSIFGDLCLGPGLCVV